MPLVNSKAQLLGEFDAPSLVPNGLYKVASVKAASVGDRFQVGELVLRTNAGSIINLSRQHNKVPPHLTHASDCKNMTFFLLQEGDTFIYTELHPAEGKTLPKPAGKPASDEADEESSDDDEDDN